MFAQHLGSSYRNLAPGVENNILVLLDTLHKRNSSDKKCEAIVRAKRKLERKKQNFLSITIAFSFFKRFMRFKIYFSISYRSDRGDACRLGSGRDSNLVLLLTLGFLPHTAGLPSFRRFYLCHHCLLSLTPFSVNLVPLTDILDNQMGLMPASVRTIVRTPVSPPQDSNSRPHHWHQPNTTVIDQGPV